MLKSLYQKSLHAAGKERIFKITSSLLHNANHGIETYLHHLVQTGKLDPMWLLLNSYKLNGIGDYGDEAHTGELGFLREMLPTYLKEKNLVLFDVGANLGNYTALLNKCFPGARIFSFEPNPEVYKILKQRETDRVKPVPCGMGRAPGRIKIHTYQHSLLGSEHGSIHKEVFSDLYHRPESVSYDIEINTIDNFCVENQISGIDLLKIDTEGYEFEVLCGATNMLRNGSIRVIQFEMNTMNIIARVFLKDFYSILGDAFHFFRLTRDGLKALGDYDPINEIFQYQNIVAVRKELRD